jgi:hypothetical protein
MATTKLTNERVGELAVSGSIIDLLEELYAQNNPIVNTVIQLARAEGGWSHERLLGVIALGLCATAQATEERFLDYQARQLPPIYIACTQEHLDKIRANEKTSVSAENQLDLH